MRIIIPFMFLILLVSAGSCQQSEKKTVTQSAAPVQKTIPADQFRQKMLMAKSALLLDVRSPEEYNSGHLEGAINIDYHAPDFREQVKKLDHDRPVLVYCLAGSRSASAAEILIAENFSEIYNLQGGTMKWKQAGYPLVSDNSAKPLTPAMTENEFLKLVSIPGNVLVDYGASWCIPCRKLAPIVEELEAEKKFKLVKIDADANNELLQARKIEGIPYLELYKDGKLTWKHEGLISREDLLKETGL
jgi:thioredoxin 1